jgi:hypothetical protein
MVSGPRDGIMNLKTCQKGGKGELRRRPVRLTPVSMSPCQKAIPLCVVSVAKAGAGPGQAVAKAYAEKIKRYCTFQELVIRPNPKNTT